MDMNEFGIKEVNAYYARRGGIRTANIKGYANVGGFSNLMQRAAAQVSAASQESQAAAKARASTTTRKAAHEAESSGESTLTNAASNKDNICCEQCRSTNQLMLQMMSRNLYSQSALNYPLSGYGAWTAYQNMANTMGNTLL